MPTHIPVEVNNCIYPNLRSLNESLKIGTYTGWKESIGHGSKLKGFLAHIYADLTDLT